MSKPTCRELLSDWQTYYQRRPKIQAGPLRILAARVERVLALCETRLAKNPSAQGFDARQERNVWEHIKRLLDGEEP